MSSNCNVTGFPKDMIIIKDCHWKNNELVTVFNSVDEWGVRLQAKAFGWHVVQRPSQMPALSRMIA